MHWKSNKLSPQCRNVIWQDELYQLVSSGHVESKTSMKTDSSCFGQYTFRSFRNIQGILSEMYSKQPAALDSVGMCSILQPGM